MAVSSKERVAVVFQGGGAKGIAYSGVLEALGDRDVEIARVAGSSAGAITAALVAAGLPYATIREEVPNGLRTIANHWSPESRGWRHAISLGRRLVREGALIPTEELEVWLAALLTSGEGERPTFQSLFERTGIELNVVAANVTTSAQLVFNHVLSPKVDVAMAVIASAAIPAVFRAGSLVGPYEAQVDMALGPLPLSKQLPATARSAAGTGRSAVAQLGMVRETLVDGGVWANYPDFVFKDESFRQWAGLDKLEEDIVGFTLGEHVGAPGADRYKDWELYNPADALRINRFESLEGGALVANTGVRNQFLVFTILTALIVTGGWLISENVALRCLAIVVAMGPAFFAWEGYASNRGRTGRIDHPPWTIESRVRLWADHLLVYLATRRGLPVVLVSLPILGSIVVAGLLFFNAVAADDALITFLVLGVLAAFLSVITLMTAVFASFALAALRYATPPLLSSLPGAARTLLAASTDVREWVGENQEYESVLRVPLPAGLDTLTFAIGEELVSRAHTEALEATALFLEQRTTD